MGNNWAEKLQKKLKEKEVAKQEAGKRFDLYQEAVLRLFKDIELKLKDVEVISTQRIFTAQTSQTTSGPWEPIKALVLKCSDSRLEFIPEGINLDSAQGRIRIRNSALGQFVYLHLIVDPESNSPEDLIWVYNEKGDSLDFESLPKFTEELIEDVIERCFLG